MAEPHKSRMGHSSQVGSASTGALIATLARLRSRARWLLLGAAGGALLSLIIAAALAVGVLDFLLRTPAWMRMAVLLAGLAAVVWYVQRWLVPAWRFRPSLTEVALRVERSGPGRSSGLEGVLASGLELAQDPPEGSTSRGMAAHVVERAQHAASQVRASTVLKPTQARHGLLVLAICVSSLAAITALVGPVLVTTGAVRLLAPWAGAEWPKRTGVVDATTLAVHPLGTALPLRAAVVRTDRMPENTRVGVRYRIVSPGADATWRRAMLAWQGRPIALDTSIPGEPARGELFERLIEPSALTMANGGEEVAELEYWFETDDDRTRARRIKLVVPPMVVGAVASVSPPGYAKALGADREGRSAFITGMRELGPGIDQRAVVGPVLAGSRVTLQIELNKAVPTPSSEGERDEEWHRWLSRVLPGIRGVGGDLDAAFEGKVWTLSWAAVQSVRIAVDPVDEHGISKLEEAAFSFDVIEDRAPTATIVEPSEDESVLATALVEITGEGRDDVGVESIGLERQIHRPARGSVGAAAEAAEEPQLLTRRRWEAPAEDGAQGGAAAPAHAMLSSRLDLGALNLRPRDEVWITAMVQDNFVAMDGSRHDPVRSSPRKLRIISEEELVDQIRAELTGLRRVAMRLDEEQAHLQETVRGGEIDSEDARRQAALTQRIAQQRGSVQRMMQRMERNRLQDEALGGLLEDVDGLFRGAARDSERAAGQMQAAAGERDEPSDLATEQAEAITQAQDEVRDQLGRMAEMLDRGEDTWLMSRTLQRLLQQQRDVQAQTERLGERTMGRRAQDLSPEEREELRRLQERQQQLADAAASALDALEERAAQMESADPAQAAAMQQAAQRGRQQQLQERMEDAAENLGENQTSTASGQQQDAMEALEQMLQDMDDAQRQRDQALRRLLATLIQSLERLIGDQTEQIEALAQGVAVEAFDGLDSGMIALNQNTLAVADTARADRATAPVAEPLDRASRAQSDAVASLRATPVNAAHAHQHEQESLRLLRDALEEAQRLEREAAERDQERTREELRRIYREALEEQVALRALAEPYIGRQIDRRDRMTVRGLGERQESLRQRLDEVRRQTEEIEQSSLFAFAHQRLDTSMASAGKKLRAGQADRSLQRNQASAVRILASLIEALDDLKRDDEFRDESESGGGGGQGGSAPELLPPIAELRLLRGMQHEAADLTRALDEADDPAARDELPLLADLQEALAERGRELVKKLDQEPELPHRMPEVPEQPQVPEQEGQQ